MAVYIIGEVISQGGTNLEWLASQADLGTRQVLYSYTLEFEDF